MRESELQRQVKAMLDKHPKIAWSFITTSGRIGSKKYALGKKGLPDIVGQLKKAWGGVSLGLEIKRPGERPTQAQEAFLEVIRSNGGLAGWCDSVEGAMEILK